MGTNPETVNGWPLIRDEECPPGMAYLVPGIGEDSRVFAHPDLDLDEVGKRIGVLRNFS
jgi:hypothetical protein